MVRRLLGLALLHTVADALPVWTDERLNTYIHCANASGPWSADSLLSIKAQQPRFVVQERSVRKAIRRRFCFWGDFDVLLVVIAARGVSLSLQTPQRRPR